VFLSFHGRIPVITIAGRLGTMRRAQACVADLVAHIKIAQKQFQQTVKPIYAMRCANTLVCTNSACFQKNNTTKQDDAS